MAADLEQLKRACCRIRCGTRIGTGYLVATNLVATCAHVVQEHDSGAEITVIFDDEAQPARVIAHDNNADCALLQLAVRVTDRTPLPLSNPPRSGQVWKAYGFAEAVIAAGMNGLMLEGRVRDPRGVDSSGAPVLVLYCEELAAGRGARLQGCSGSPVMVEGAVVGHLRRIIPECPADENVDGRLRAEFGQALACPSGRLAALKPGELEVVRLPALGSAADAQQLLAVGLAERAAQVLATGVGGAAGEYSARIAGFFSEYLGRDAEHRVPFGGRRGELARLTDWLDEPKRSARLLLTAPAGRGKSALLVHWCVQLSQRKDLTVLLFPISARFSTNLASVTMTALVAAMARLHDEVAPVAAGADIARGHLTRLLQRPLPAGRRLVLILDGVDEAADWRLGADLVPLTLPADVKVIVAARERAATASWADWLQEFGWTRPMDAECMTLPPLGLSEVVDIVTHMAASAQVAPPPAADCASLHRLSEGDPLLLQLYLRDALAAWTRCATPRWSELLTTAAGLDGYFAAWWQDQRRIWGPTKPHMEPTVHAVVSLLAAALGPLTKDDLLGLAPMEVGLNSLSLAEVLDDLGRFVIGDDRLYGYVFGHSKIAAWFYDAMSSVERRNWDGRFLDYGGLRLAELREGRLQPNEFPRYFVEYYGAHLDRAKRGADEYLLMLSTEWYRAWRTHDPTLDGFLHDVQRAWRVADSLILDPSDDHPPAASLVQTLRCALVFSGVVSVNSHVTPALLGALVDKQIWSPTQALLYVRRYQPEAGVMTMLAPQINLAASVRAIVSHLREEHLSEVLGWMRSPRSAYEANEILAALVPYLQGPLFDLAVAHVRAMPDGAFRSQALRLLLSRAPVRQRRQLLESVLECIRAIPDPRTRSSELAECITDLEDDQLDSVQEIVDGLTGRPWYRSAPLARLALRRAEARRLDMQRAALQPLLDAAQDASSAFDWHIPRRLAEVVPYIPELLLREAQAIIGTIDNEALRGELLEAFHESVRGTPLDSSGDVAATSSEPTYEKEVPLGRLSRLIQAAHQLTSTQRQELWQRIRDVDDVGDRALCMARLLPHLPDPCLGLAEILSDLPRICRAADPYQRPLILETLAAHLPADALRLILTELHFIDDAPQRIAAVAALLQFVSRPQCEHLADGALAICHSIQDDEQRIRSILELIPFMPRPQQEATARKLMPAISELKPCPTETGYSGDGLHDSWWCKLQLDPLFGNELSKIPDELRYKAVPYLPEELRIEVLRDLLKSPESPPRRSFQLRPNRDAAMSLGGWDPREDILTKHITALASHFARDLLEDTRTAISTLKNSTLRATAMAALSHASAKVGQEVGQAIAMVRKEGHEPSSLTANLADIVKNLPEGTLRTEVASEIVAYLSQVEPSGWAERLKPIAAHLTEADKRAIWALILEFPYEQDRVESMVELAPLMPDDIRTLAVQETVDCLQSLVANREDPVDIPPDFESGYLREQGRLFRSRRQGLAMLAKYLPEEILITELLASLTFEPEHVLPQLVQAAVMRSRTVACQVWHQSLQVLSTRSRREFLARLVTLAPLLALLVGTNDVEHCVHVILDLQENTPSA